MRVDARSTLHDYRLRKKRLASLQMRKAALAQTWQKLSQRRSEILPEEWLKWDSQYRLSVAEADVSDIERRAHLYSLAPVRDMQKRGLYRCHG